MNLYRTFNFRCLFPECFRNKIKTQSMRDVFFRGHAMKKSTDRVVDVLKIYGIDLPFEKLGRYTILNIYTDLCIEPNATDLIDGVNDE